MKVLRDALDKAKHNFEKGGKWEKFYLRLRSLRYVCFCSKHYRPPKGAQVRDAVDMKRLMMTVIIAMVPCLIFGMFNVGYQHFLALGQKAGIGEMFWIGAVKVVPIIIVSYASGLGVEFILPRFEDIR
jgi:Na+-transporting NADH:ubiquinone oxidoreductase subunit B